MPRKASASITLTTLAAPSLTFAAACAEDEGPEVTADCVVKQPDGTFKAVDDDLCDDDDHHGGSSFVWIYGGSSGSNGRITGGTFNRPTNANISTRSGSVISRGGFGGRSGGGS